MSYHNSQSSYRYVFDHHYALILWFICMNCRRHWGTMCLSRSLCYWWCSSPSHSSKFQKQKTNLQRKLLICSKLHQHGGKQRMTHPWKICLRKKIISNLTTVTFNHWGDHLVFRYMIMPHSSFVFTHKKLYNSGQDYIDDDWVWKVNVATIFFFIGNSQQCFCRYSVRIWLLVGG